MYRENCNAIQQDTFQEITHIGVFFFLLFIIINSKKKPRMLLGNLKNC